MDLQGIGSLLSPSGELIRQYWLAQMFVCVVAVVIGLAAVRDTLAVAAVTLLAACSIALFNLVGATGVPEARAIVTFVIAPYYLGVLGRTVRG